MFEHIIGQENVKKTISSMVKTGRIPHALLFVGPYGVGKAETALEMARMLLCENGPDSGCTTCRSCIRASKIEHPDLHVLFPFRAPPKSSKDYNSWVDELLKHRNIIGKEPYAPVTYEKSRQIVVDLVREVHEKLLESSFEGGRKVCVILSADRLNVQTANSLLKILEEPPGGVQFILTTERLSSVLPTITSRASVVRFRRLNQKEIAAYLENTFSTEPEESMSYASLAEGSLRTAKAFAFESKAALRSRAIDLYRTVALGEPDEVAARAAQFTWSRDITEAEELIGGFALFTRTILKKKYGMLHQDDALPDDMAALIYTTDLHALQKLSAGLENGLEMLGRNVNISTVMTSIFYEINDAYR